MKKLTFSEFVQVMTDAREKRENLAGYIVYSEKNWTTQYSIEARTYRVHNSCNYFDNSKISRALWGDALDNSDDNVRLDYYLGKWEIEYCYL